MPPSSTKRMPQKASNRFAIVATDWRRISSASDSRLRSARRPRRRRFGARPDRPLARRTRRGPRAGRRRCGTPRRPRRAVASRRRSARRPARRCRARRRGRRRPELEHDARRARSARPARTPRAGRRTAPAPSYSTRFARITNSRRPATRAAGRDGAGTRPGRGRSTAGSGRSRRRPGRRSRRTRPAAWREAERRLAVGRVQALTPLMTASTSSRCRSISSCGRPRG